MGIAMAAAALRGSLRKGDSGMHPVRHVQRLVPIDRPDGSCPSGAFRPGPRRRNG